MIIENTFTVQAPRDDVARFLLDPERMLPCVPGAEDIRRLDDGRYAAALAVKVGPIRAAFQGQFALDGSGAPETIVADGEARDRGSGSTVQARLDATLSEGDGDTTKVATRVDITIRGRLGQFGSGVMQSVSNEMVGAFASCVQARLSGNEDAEATAPAGSPNLASIAARGLVKGSVGRLTGKRNRDSDEGKDAGEGGR